VKDLNHDAKAASRRDFVKMASVGAVGAAAAALAGGAPSAEAAESNSKDRGYRLTDHVKKAYAAARF
jgi:hypothetical protein